MLGPRIALLRRSQGLNQAELAQRLGLSPSTVGMYEQGRREPDCQTLCALAEILQTTTDFLLTGRLEPPGARDLLAALTQAAQGLGEQLLLRSPDGQIRPFDQDDWASLLAAMTSGGTR